MPTGCGSAWSIPATATPIQVVCGAPNARTGMTSVFAPPGAFIPGKNITLGIGKIRDVESRGMLVSEAELQISDNHDGIIDLPDDAPVGTIYAKYAGLDDPVIEINLTPNRADGTGVHGIARDLAAADMGKFRDAGIKPIKGEFPCPVHVKLDFGATPSLCPGFALRLVRGVKNGPSPEWLQKRLIAIGLRPINALVDITNFITYDRGRPLHVFDAAKVHGNLTVRRAQAGETLLALDGKTYTLDDTICVIADDQGVESLAGIMGGEQTGCSETTTDVLIEVGAVGADQYRADRPQARHQFRCPLSLRARRRSGLHAAGPRTGDPHGDGSVRRHAVGDHRRRQRRGAGAHHRFSAVRARAPRRPRCAAPRNAPRAGAPRLLRRRPGRAGKIAVPSWRPDVQGKADIVEEVVRIVGVDRVPLTPFGRGEAPRKPVLTPIQSRTRKAKRALAARNLVEAVTWSFIAKTRAELFGGGKPELALANPIAADLSDMRPSLIPGLVAAAQKNADRGFPDAGLFEVGQIFRGDTPADQFTAAAGIRRALAKPSGIGRHWLKRDAEVDAFDAKADALTVLTAAGAPAAALQVVPGGPPWFHPGRSGTIQIGPQNVLGHFGELHPSALEALDAEGPLVAFEVILERIPEPKAKPTRAKPALDLSPFQPVERDFAFVVERNVKAADIVRAAQIVDRKLIAGVSVFDVYEGKGIEPGKKSIAIAVTLQPRDKTMTDAEIEALAAKIVAEVGKRTGGVLRA